MQGKSTGQLVVGGLVGILLLVCAWGSIALWFGPTTFPQRGAIVLPAPTSSASASRSPGTPQPTSAPRKPTAAATPTPSPPEPAPAPESVAEGGEQAAPAEQAVVGEAGGEPQGEAVGGGGFPEAPVAPPAPAAPAPAPAPEPPPAPAPPAGHDDDDDDHHDGDRDDDDDDDDGDDDDDDEDDRSPGQWPDWRWMEIGGYHVGCDAAGTCYLYPY